MIFLIKFDEKGFRQQTYPLEENDPKVKELIEKGYEKVSEEDYNKLLGNYDGKPYIKTAKGFEPYVYVPTKEDEIQILKNSREEEIADLAVEVDGMIFDANELSQERIARLLLANSGKDTDVEVEWVLANNEVKVVSLQTLKKVLENAFKATSYVWLKPYKNI